MRRMFVRVLIAAAVSAIAARSGTDQVADEKVREIRKFLEYSGARQSVETMLPLISNTLTAQIKAQLGQQSSTLAIPERFFQDLPALLEKEFTANVDDLINRIIPYYDKYFTLEELKEFNRFFESPAGVKIRSAQPKLLQETTPIGVQWGQDIAPKIMAKVLVTLGTYWREPGTNR